MWSRINFWLVVAVFLSAANLASGYISGRGIAMSDEKRLITHLLDNYKKVGVVGRPVFNTSETVSVSYGLALIQILDLDEKNQVLTTNVWSRYFWNDVLLRWNPDNFGGVKEIRVPADQIWTPDIVLYNYADTRLEEQRRALAVVSSNGNVLWIPMAIFKSTCSIDITNFPFDQQECHLKFGSWTYDGFKVNVDFYEGMEQVDITDYVPSNEWYLVAHPAVRNVKHYPCCQEPYLDLTFTIVMKRMAAFYKYVLILPCILLSVLTLVVFWLPPESSAKMVLGMNVFVAFFLLLRILADSTPPASSSVPLIGSYFCLNMILITLSTFLSVIVINIYFRANNRNKVPKWLRIVMLDGFARAMFMRTKGTQEKEKTSVTHIIETPTNLTGTKCSMGNGRKGVQSRKKIKSPVLKYNKWEPPSPLTYRDESPLPVSMPRQEMPLFSNALEHDVREIRKCLKTYYTRVQDRDAKMKIAQEWRTVAVVLDRMFFFIYVLTISVSLATIFPSN